MTKLHRNPGVPNPALDRAGLPVPVIVAKPGSSFANDKRRFYFRVRPVGSSLDNCTQPYAALLTNIYPEQTPFLWAPKTLKKSGGP